MQRLLIALSLWFAVLLPAQAYSVVNGQIRDTNGQAVELRGINWFGFETETLAAHGLWKRNWKELIAQIKTLNFNAVRLPICPSTLRGAAVSGVDGALNPDLVGLNSLQLLDAFIKEFDRQGIYVLLDHHRPDCQAQSQLWYTDFYSERDWINDLRLMAERYRRVGSVLGIDLKNEPHGVATWGSGDKTTDWNLAAERAASEVLAVAPNWLVFVEGIGHTKTCTNTPAHFWGENLEVYDCAPLNIPRRNLVLSPHVYGPDVAEMPYFKAPNFPANMPAVWDAHFGQHSLRGHAVVLGEFGGGYGHCATLQDRTWHNALVDYLISRGMTSAFYWTLNPNSTQTGGLLKDDWQTVWEDKYAMLQALFTQGRSPLPPPFFGPKEASACSLAAPHKPTGAPAGVGDPNFAGPRKSLGFVKLDALRTVAGQVCRDAEIRNDVSNPIAWQLRVRTTGAAGTVSENAKVEAADAEGFWLRGRGRDATLAPGEKARISICAAQGFEVAPPSPLPIKPAPSPSIPAAAAKKPTPPAQLAPTAEGFKVEMVKDSSWEQGYCARVLVQNQSNELRAWRVSLPVHGIVQKVWKAKSEHRNGQLRAQGEDYNRALKPKESTDFGFCVDY